MAKLDPDWVTLIENKVYGPEADSTTGEPWSDQADAWIAAGVRAWLQVRGSRPELRDRGFVRIMAAVMRALDDVAREEHAMGSIPRLTKITAAGTVDARGKNRKPGAGGLP